MKQFILVLAGVFLVAVISPVRFAAPDHEPLPVTVRAAGRGNPHINLEDGRPIPARFEGPPATVAALERRGPEPLSLASADFDEDGMPDLVCGFAEGPAGIVTIHRGNVDAVYPNAPEAKERLANGTNVDAPFWPDAKAFELPGPADFIGAGDFDADGHADVVTASKAEDILLLLRGDGTGHLLPPETIQLPGEVTAFVTGEINRRDGLTDLVVAVQMPSGGQVLIFEHPQGALRGMPEAHTLSETGTDLVLGRISGDFIPDLAIAAGSSLVVIEGRDRRLSFPEDARQAAGRVARREFPLPFKSRKLVLGRFGSDPKLKMAILDDTGALHRVAVDNLESLINNEDQQSVEVTTRGEVSMARLIAAKVSSKPGQDLVLVHPGKRRLDLLNVRETVSQKGDSSTPVSLDVEGVPVAVLPMRLSPDALDDLVIATDSPAGLVTTVTTFASIFTVTNTNLTGTGSFEEAISDADSNPGMDTIVFNIPGSGPHTIVPGRNIRCPTEPVLIDATTQPGFSGTPLVEIDGSLAVTGTGNNGLCLSGNGVVIRGFAINNYVHPSPSVVGIGIAAMSAGGHIIEGNFIGTDPSGLVSIPNERGVTVGLDPPGSGITIGGTVAAARNVISGNQTQVWIGAPGNEIVGNYIGTDATGTSLLAGTETGIHISGSNNNNIGTNIPGSGNVIVPGGAFSAILISPGISGVATGNLIQGNLIGTNASGTVALSTGLGVDIQTASNTVGGTSPFTRNVISSDGGERGVHLGGSGATLNQVQGNYIGTDSSGTVALGNNYGVFVGNANGNLVGGASAGAGNVVSGNVVAGVEINGGSDNIIQGNLVGTDAVGTAPIPGGDGAIYVFSATDTLVLDNVTGSTDFGVVLSGASPTTGTKLAGNFIGTDASGTIDLGHSSVGVLVQADATGNLIGGLLSVERNIIAFNGDAGVRVAAAGPANRIWFNSIHSNVGLGIDLEGIGVNPNDAGDADVGSNDLQNFPDLSFADTSGTTVTVGGTLSSEPNTTYMLQFFASPSCDPSGNGEGMTYLGSDITATDGTGLGVFRQRVTGGIIPAGQAVTATATDPSGSTSEFSQCRNAVGVPPGLVPNLGFDDLTGLSLSWDPVPDAITYHLYQGVDQDLPKLLSSEADSCRRYSTAATTTSNVITDSPDEGMMLWYLMTTEGTYGEGNPADGTKPRQLDSSGDCQATCLHGSCTTGGPLDPLCGVCEANICQADPFCCQQEWDDLCVEEVRTICGSLTCQESAGQCAHPLCEEGDLLLNKCDDPPVTPSCADAICAVDPFCCQQSWDSVCVGEVATICSFNCD